MLVIRCREGESVAIGEDIEVTVLSAGAGRVKLGFNAPNSVPVARRCAELTRQQNRAAIQEIDSGLLEKLGPYLSQVQTNGVPCVVSLDTMAQSTTTVGLPKEFSQSTLDSAPAVDK